MAFDRLCLHNGIRHLLTAPYSPTTTGKIERLHKTMRKEFFDGRRFTSISQAQAELDAWVPHYNLEREHQAIGDVAPIRRFELVEKTSRPQTGWESLTPTESSVVQLVADGLRNRDIAERLFISRRTVETHLTHVFGKLGISSRTELVAISRRQSG